ncbi:hypothetical protein SH528x_004360 [Novipirellula sp. SH528]|uniref:hypothetical protein n=1 Tax=Novipirellula sp. SH528 TaxID=3454466 RepID=UPI003FA01160
MPFLFALACLLSGTYGAVHNQISYSVSPEYFTKFKFEQFHISPHFHNRLGAAFVGWQASWWMGLVIGTFLIPAGMLVRDNREYVIAVLRSFFVVLCTTVITGLTALLIAYFVVHPDPTEEFVFRNARISDSAAFWRDGAMHNFSYLGGLLGIATGLASILRSFLAENARLQITIPDGETPRQSE